MTDIMWGPEPDLKTIQENQVVYLVMFHYPCRDGFASAWAASRFLPREHTWFVPCNYTDDAWGVVDGRGLSVQEAFKDWRVFNGKSVLICDFSLPLEVLAQIAQQAEQVTVLDHHLKFRQDLERFADLSSLPDGPHAPPLQVHLPEGWPENLRIQYHDFRCGALQTWDWFRAGNSEYRYPECRAAFELIDDRDRWVWALPNSKAFHAAMDGVDDSFEEWDVFVPRFCHDVEYHASFLQQGEMLLQMKQKRCASRAEKMFCTTFKGIPTPIPTLNTTDEVSDTCHEMLVQNPWAPFVASYFDKDPETRIWSLRSRKGEGVDVCAIAKERGGGGHPTAAGFRAAVCSLDGVEI